MRSWKLLSSRLSKPYLSGESMHRVVRDAAGALTWCSLSLSLCLGGPSDSDPRCISCSLGHSQTSCVSHAQERRDGGHAITDGGMRTVCCQEAWLCGEQRARVASGSLHQICTGQGELEHEAAQLVGSVANRPALVLQHGMSSQSLP